MNRAGSQTHGRGAHLRVVQAALLEAGQVGRSAGELADVAGIKRDLMGVLLYGYRKRQYVRSEGTRKNLRWFLGPGPEPKDPGQRQAQRRDAVRVVKELMKFAGITLAELRAAERLQASATVPTQAPSAPRKVVRAGRPGAQLVVQPKPSYQGATAVPHRPDPRAPAIIPTHVKVQVIPGGRDTRLDVDPSHEGEFMAEWRARIGAPRA